MENKYNEIILLKQIKHIIIYLNYFLLMVISAITFI